MSEFDEFISQMGDVKPLKKTANTIANAKFGSTDINHAARRSNAEKVTGVDGNPLQTEAIELLKPDDVLEYKKSGVQAGVYKNLRLGKYEIHSVLNLHNSSVNEARTQVWDTINQAHKNNVRCLLIQHGKGVNSQPHQAVLKSYINKWLRQFDSILAFHSAQPFHGGLGATYALLKKSDGARLDNKERHQKRGANK